MDIHDRWELVTKDGEEFLKYDRVTGKHTRRKDLHAFIILDTIFPGTSDIVASAEHDQIWLDVDSEQIERLTDDQILMLSRCGVFYDSEVDSLAMFV